MAKSERLEYVQARVHSSIILQDLRTIVDFETCKKQRNSILTVIEMVEKTFIEEGKNGAANPARVINKRD